MCRRHQRPARRAQLEGRGADATVSESSRRRNHERAKLARARSVPEHEGRERLLTAVHFEIHYRQYTNTRCWLLANSQELKANIEVL